MIEQLEQRIKELRLDINHRLAAKQKLLGQLTAVENGIKEKNGALIEVSALLEQAKRLAAETASKKVQKKVTSKK